jgi:hypothetical protein
MPSGLWLSSDAAADGAPSPLPNFPHTLQQEFGVDLVAAVPADIQAFWFRLMALYRKTDQSPPIDIVSVSIFLDLDCRASVRTTIDATRTHHYIEYTYGLAWDRDTHQNLLQTKQIQYWEKGK